MSDNDLPEDDPLARWRPDAPWPEEEKELWKQLLNETSGDTRVALETLEDRIEALSADGAIQAEITPCSLILRLLVSLLGTEHRDTLIALNNVAYRHQAHGDARRALPLHKHALERRDAVLGEDHPDTLISLSNLAHCYVTLGQARRALPLHERSLDRRRAVLGEDHPDTLISLNNLAHCHGALGDARRALAFYEEAFERRRELLGDNHSDTILSLGNLAHCHGALGNARRALPLHEEVLERRRALQGEDHPATLISLGNLAHCLVAVGDARRALPLLEQVLDRRRTVLGEDHPDTLISLGNLAHCHVELGDARRALLLYEQALERRRTVLGEDHPDTILSLGNLAHCHRALGDARRALPLHYQVAELSRTVLGEDHPHTLTSLGNLASCHEALGEARRALPLQEAVFKRRRVVLGEDHPDTISSLNNLGYCHRALGDFLRALPLYERALERRRMVLGEDHPDTLGSLNDLAACHEALGNPGRALPLFKEALNRRREVLGENHPDTLSSLNNLAHCRVELGDARRALQLHEKLLKRRQAVLGETHPHTLISLRNLAHCYVTLGQARQALPLHEEALERSRAVLGEDHPDTLASLGNLAHCYEALGDARRALPLFKQAHERRREVLGEDHPDTLISLGNLGSCYGALGDWHRALQFCKQVLERRRTVLGDDHAHTIFALNNLAFGHLALGNARRALPLFEEALERRQAVLNADHPDTLISLGNLAHCYGALGDVRRALPLHEQVFESSRAVLGEDHPDSLRALHNLAATFQLLGDGTQSALHFDELLDLLGWRPDRGGIWLELVVRASSSTVSLASVGHSNAWRAPSRSISRGFLEDMDLTEPSDVAHILGPFREFHANWLRLCLADGAAEEIPHVLSAVQGREMAAMLLSELEANEADYPDGDPRKLYLEVVRELRQLRLMLRSAEKRDELGGGFDDGNRRFQADAETALRLAKQSEAMTAQRREVYARLMEQMKELRGQIAKLDDTFRLAYAPPNVSVERLSEEMGANEAKVLLFMHAREDGTEPVPHACCITADGKAEILVLEAMPAAREAMNSAGLRGTARMGMRGGWRGAAPRPKQISEETPIKDDALVEEQQADLAALMGKALWQPLRAKFPQVTSWHLATHQDLHVLPVGLGLDPAHTMTVHPGLLFLARKQEDAINDDAPSRLAMHSDPAAGTSNPIPFVEAETELARLVWGHDRIALSKDEETLDRLNEVVPPLDALLLAAHGDELDSEPPQTIVWLDRARERMLDTTAVLSAGQRPPVVIASACVAGRVREDSLGEPLGLVSAFFLHGARFVLAPLQPIPDLQAPLVMGLFHRAWHEIGNPRRAWQVAIDQALTGQWPEGYEEQLRAAYAPVMRAMLGEATKKPSYISVIVNAGWSIKLTDQAGLFASEDDDHEIVEARKALIDRLVENGIGQILDERVKATQGKPSAAIRRICDWTMPFGS